MIKRNVSINFHYRDKHLVAHPLSLVFAILDAEAMMHEHAEKPISKLADLPFQYVTRGNSKMVEAGIYFVSSSSPFVVFKNAKVTETVDGEEINVADYIIDKLDAVLAEMGIPQRLRERKSMFIKNTPFLSDGTPVVNGISFQSTHDGSWHAEFKSSRGNFRFVGSTEQVFSLTPSSTYYFLLHALGRQFVGKVECFNFILTNGKSVDTLFDIPALLMEFEREVFMRIFGRPDYQFIYRHKLPSLTVNEDYDRILDIFRRERMPVRFEMKHL